MTRYFIVVLLILAVAVGLAALPETAAMNRTINRPPVATLGNDPTSALGLVSFANTGFAITGNYVAAGTVRNNLTLPVTITMSARPTVTQACQSVTGGVCTATGWTLYLCLATDQSSVGKQPCKPNGGSSQLTFTGAAPGTVPTQSFTAFSAASGQTLYLMVRGALNSTSGTNRLCAQTAFTVNGTTTRGPTVTLTNGATVPRSEIYRLGSGCP